MNCYYVNDVSIGRIMKSLFHVFELLNNLLLHLHSRLTITHTHTHTAVVFLHIAHTAASLSSVSAPPSLPPSRPLSIKPRLIFVLIRPKQTNNNRQTELTGGLMGAHSPVTAHILRNSFYRLRNEFSCKQSHRPKDKGELHTE